LEQILGYSITRQDRDACVQQIVSWIISDKNTEYFACANPHSIELAYKDALFAEALKSAHLLVPDGVGVHVFGCKQYRMREFITLFSEHSEVV